MAIVTGGILGRPRGKTSGIVFSSARSRLGKVVTAREFVIPSNPQTADQTAQRTLFKRSLVIVKGWGPDLYQIDFNRAIQQLPGFQSCMSFIMHNKDESGIFTVPPDLPLGDLHFPNTFSIEGGSSQGEIDITWSTEVGSNGTSADLVKGLCYATEGSFSKQFDKDLVTATRADGATGITFSSCDPGEKYICAAWVVGAGAADGLISKCSFDWVLATV
jgi:hypothetical protein